MLIKIKCPKCGEYLYPDESEIDPSGDFLLTVPPCQCTVNDAVNEINEKMEILEQQTDEDTLPEASKKANNSSLLLLASGMRAAREVIKKHAGIS